MYISSVNNDFIKETAKLKEKKYRDITNTFLVEGEHLVSEAIKNNILIKIIVCDDYEYETDVEKIIVSLKHLRECLKHRST